MTGSAIRVEHGPGGEVLHLVPFLPPALPSVTRFHLEQAWEAARHAASASNTPKPRCFRFTEVSSPPLDLALADRDAASWAGGVENIADLSTAYGISLCLRLLALVDLMGRAEWMRPWFSLKRSGATIHPGLLQAVALAPLTPTGGFAETSLRALLPAEN